MNAARTLPGLGLAGPTASGKTVAALAIAATLAERHRPVEIVSVDSALVYRGMDIGTAKPSAAERASVPHHLIDILDPREPYSAARFVADAHRIAAEIEARGALPLFVGGTMLYFKALFEGLDAMPAADAEVRAALAARLDREGLAALHAELARVDPVTAVRLPPGDRQRILRALEVHRISGRPLSSFHGTANAASRSEAAREAFTTSTSSTSTSTSAPDPAPMPLISLEPADRAWLHARIAARFRGMLDDGLVDEVRALKQRRDLRADLPSMRCVGYRQAWDALDAGEPIDLDRLAERGIAATRQLAKRQTTWLRGMPARHVVACDGTEPIGRTVALALALVGRHRPEPATA